MNTETLVGRTTRPVTFSYTDLHTRKCIESRTFPTGTEVYVSENRRGLLTIRIPGSLFMQDVNGATVEAI